jgi:hypothetical protein
MNIEYIEVESSNIKTIGYDPVHDILSVTFHKEGFPTDTYWYFEVPALAWADFHDAESKGKFLFSSIKGKYRYLKVTHFKEDLLLDALEMIRRKNVNEGFTNEPLSATCERYGLDYADTWDALMGRQEWYQHQSAEYKREVMAKVAELELGYHKEV